MSTARQEEIIKKGFIKSLLEGTLELKDLAGINIDLDIARQAYIQGVQESNLAVQGKIYVLTASDTIQLEDLGAEANWGTDYVKKKQFTIMTSGAVRVTGEIFASEPFTAYCEIRINDIAVDSWSTGSEEWTPKTSDIAIGVGDLLQMWIACSGDSDSNLRNARIRCTSDLGAPIVGVVS